MIRSAFGPAPFDLVFLHLKLTTPLTMGLATFMIQGVIILFVSFMRKSARYLGSFAALVVGGVAIDFWDLLVFADFVPSNFIVRILIYAGGLYFLTLGLAITATTNLATVSFDELMYLIMDWFHTKNVIIVRLPIEFSGILLGILISGLGGLGLGEATLASVVIAIVLPSLLQQQLKILKRFGFTRV